MKISMLKIGDRIKVEMTMSTGYITLAWVILKDSGLF
jgi:hypothetical protein